jgi:hypothetical protein
VGAAVTKIEALASGSQCAAYSFKNRGHAPKGYMKGIALVFARAVCQQSSSMNALLEAPKTNDDLHDALSWYNSIYSSLGMSNVGGLDTLRHVYNLNIGSGMMESSGKYCCGRDMSSDFSSASSAEAGPMQTSYGAIVASPTELGKLYAAYQSSTAPKCYLDVFQEGASCGSGDATNWGSGVGYNWQVLTKKCPAFAVEWAAVLLRKTGGSKGEFGPVRKHLAEVVPACDDMLLNVQNYVLANPFVCGGL